MRRARSVNAAAKVCTWRRRVLASASVAAVAVLAGSVLENGAAADDKDVGVRTEAVKETRR